MSQSDFGNLESPLPGRNFINDDLEPWRDAVHTSHSGNSRPSYAVPGMVWLDTTTTPWLWKMFNGSQDITLGIIDPTARTFGISGGAIENSTIGLTTPAAGKFTNIQYTGEITYVSDRRYKKAIKPLAGMLGLLMKLRPVSFFMRNGDSKRTHMGFIAQDVQKVLPNLVGKSDNGFLHLHGQDLVAVLAGAVQELTMRVEKLEKEKKFREKTRK